jgi:microcystin-dependent protein
MNEPYLGGIFIVGFNFAPVGYALCNGQTMPITQNTALFSLLGTFYGGNGTSTFALPDLRGRLPIHQGQGVGLSSYTIGQTGGTETVTLLTSQIPAHTHALGAFNGAGSTSMPAGAYLAQGPSTGSGPNATALNTYNPNANAAPLLNLNAGAIQTVGGGQPHTNIQPYLCVTYVMAMQGIFPSRN